MALAGEDYQVYLKDVYTPMAIKTYLSNTIWFQQDQIPINTNVVAGKTINHMIRYARTNNAEAYVRGAPMPDNSKSSDVRAYFDKAHFQGSGKVYGIDLAEGANGGTEIPINMTQDAINESIEDVLVKISASITTSLGAQVDSTTAYSDAALARATYSLASLETAVGGALTLAAMEDLLEGLQDTTYGIIGTEDLVWLMPRNQLTNLSRLALGTGALTAYEGNNPLDAGKVFRTKSFEQIPILVIPGMTTTEIYLVNKRDSRIDYHNPIKVTPKDTSEWADQFLSVGGANLIVGDPRRCGKLTGVTA